MTWLDALADKALDCELPTREEALAVLRSSDDELMDLVAAAFRVRRRFFGRRVKLNYLVNIKSGLCPEDCFYCSQRVGSAADVLKYSWLKTDEVIATAEAGVAGGARRVCLVASGRGPTDRDIDRVASTIASFKARNPDVEVCACLGLLSDGQAERLAAAGTTAYNHNLNTSGGHYADICTTHEYADRVSTVDAAKSAGLSPCSGLIAGMGETDEDLVDVAFALRALSPDSVPVNFLIPFDGTPLAGQWELTPQRCLRILAMVRFVCPSAEVRLAGGREIHLRTLQPLALHIVNSIFLGDYLTSEGQPGAADLAMIADAGFTVEGVDNPPAASPRPATPAPTPAPTTALPISGAGPGDAPPRPGPRPPPRRRHHPPRQHLTPPPGLSALFRGWRDSVVVAVGVAEAAPLVERNRRSVAGLYLEEYPADVAPGGLGADRSGQSRAQAGPPSGWLHLDGGDPGPAVGDREPGDCQHVVAGADAGERLDGGRGQHIAHHRRLPVLTAVVVPGQPGLVRFGVHPERGVARKLAGRVVTDRIGVIGQVGHHDERGTGASRP